MKPAVVDISVDSTTDVPANFQTVSMFLRNEGFQELKPPDNAAALIQRQNLPAEIKASEMSRLLHGHTFVSETARIRVMWMDYSNGDLSARITLIAPPAHRFIEIEIFDERQSELSTNASRFFNRFTQYLKDSNIGQVTVLYAPPEAHDEPNILANSILIAIARAARWLAVALICFVLTGFVTWKFLRRLPMSRGWLRFSFVVINAWLIVPLPFPSTITYVVLPNILAFPWSDGTIYTDSPIYTITSMFAAVVICGLTSAVIFRSAHVQRVASNPS